MSEDTVVAIPHPRYPATEIFTPESRVLDTMKILRGRFDFEPFAGEPRPRTLLDLAAGHGAFAAWAYSRWPYLWCDCCEPDERLRKLLVINAPPGTRVHAVSVLDQLEAVEKSAPVPDLTLRAVNDVVHMRPPDLYFEEMRIDWGAAKIVVIEEIATTSEFMKCAAPFARFGFELKACDPTFQTWVRS